MLKIAFKITTLFSVLIFLALMATGIDWQIALMRTGLSYVILMILFYLSVLLITITSGRRFITGKQEESVEKE